MAVRATCAAAAARWDDTPVGMETTAQAQAHIASISFMPGVRVTRDTWQARARARACACVVRLRLCRQECGVEGKCTAHRVGLPKGNISNTCTVDGVQRIEGRAVDQLPKHGGARWHDNHVCSCEVLRQREATAQGSMRERVRACV